MLIHLYVTNSEKNRLRKNLVDEIQFEGTLKSETSITTPVFVIEYDGIFNRWNYAYINDFGRWYFVDNIVSIRNKLWEFHCSVDVLQTYSSDILKSTALLNSAAKVTSHGSIYAKDRNSYISSNKYVTSVKASTEIIKFPNALLDQGEWILVTAGGV